MQNLAQKSSVRRRLSLAALALASVAAIGTALPAVQDWWHGWTASEKILEDGRKHLIVTDPDGNVDFDEILEPKDSVLMTDEGDYIIIEPLEQVESGGASGEDVDAMIDQILSESDGGN